MPCMPIRRDRAGVPTRCCGSGEECGCRSATHVSGTGLGRHAVGRHSDWGRLLSLRCDAEWRFLRCGGSDGHRGGRCAIDTVTTGVDFVRHTCRWAAVLLLTCCCC